MPVMDSYTEAISEFDAGAYENYQIGQTFTASSSYMATSVRVKACKEETPGIITCSLYATEEGLPVGEALATATIDDDELSEYPTYEWVEFEFDESIQIESGQIYAIAFSVSGTGVLGVIVDAGAGYGNGNYIYSSDGGSNWQGGATDMLFEILGEGAGIIRMIDFTYSSSIAYSCEFGNKYIRFYYGDNILRDESNDPVWISFPYLTADLFQIQYKQIGDTMWLVHENYAPRKLTRTSATSFSLDEIPYNKGPFLMRNDLLNLDTKTVALMSFSGGILTCDGDIFGSGHVGALFKLIHPRPKTFIEQSGSGISAVLDAKEEITFLTRGTWTGKIILQRNQNNSGWDDFRTWKGTKDAHQNILFTHVEEEDNVQFRINAEDADSAFQGELTLDAYLQEGIVKITNVSDANSASAYPIVSVASETPTKRWAEGAWSDVRKYPNAITFFEDRLVLAGKKVIQEQILQYLAPPE